MIGPYRVSPPVAGICPASEATFSTRPQPRATMPGSSRRLSSTGAVSMTRIMAAWSAGSVERKPVVRLKPALLIRPSTARPRAAIASTRRAGAPGSARSAATTAADDAMMRRQFIGQSRQRPFAPGGQDQVVAPPRALARQGRADAGGGPRDQDGAARLPQAARVSR